MMPAFGQALVANLGRGELVAGALLDLGRPDSEQPQVIERAKAFLGLHEQNRRIAAHRLGQVRLHVPGVGNDHIIRRERIDRARNRWRIVGTFHSLSANSMAWRSVAPSLPLSSGPPSSALRPPSFPTSLPIPHAGYRA